MQNTKYGKEILKLTRAPVNTTSVVFISVWNIMLISMLIANGLPEKTTTLLVAIVMIIFGISCLYSQVAGDRNETVFTIYEKGIWSKVSNLTEELDYFIPWNEIKDFKFQQEKNYTMLEITPNHIGKYFSTNKIIPAIKNYMKFMRGQMTITTDISGLNVEPLILKQILEQHIDEQNNP